MQNTLVEAVWPIADGRKLIRNITLAITGSLVLTLSAKISLPLPFSPVPVTMQTLVVLLIGMTYGWKLGGATILLYLAEGAAGLPVFAGTPEKGIGIAYMLGTTGGYLLGFVLAAVLCGWLAERGWGKSIITTIFAMLIGTTLIFIPGLLWLGSVLGWDKPILAWGLLPFLPGAVAKILIATGLLPLCWKLIGRGSDNSNNTTSGTTSGESE